MGKTAREDRDLDTTWGIAMLVVGSIISIVAATADDTVSTALVVAGFLLVLVGMLALDKASRRR